jgi:hypothetical protein
VKKLALPILAFSLGGLVSLFLPAEKGSMASVWMEHDPMHFVLMLAAFGVPAVMSAMALVRPVQTWQCYLALAGYAIATMKTEVWSLAGKLGSAPPSFLLLFVAIIGGAIFSILAFAKQEEANAAIS